MQWLKIFEKEENLWPKNNIKFSLKDITQHISEGGLKNFLWNFKNNEKRAYDLLNDLISIIEED